MAYRFKETALLVISLLLLLLVSCSSSNSIEEQIYNIFEKTAVNEQPFVEQQDKILSLEKEENEIFNKIIELGMKEQQQIIDLAEQAITINEQRHDLINNEIDTLASSAEEFNKVIDLVTKIEDETMKEIVTNLIDVMLARYELHETLSTHYLNGLRADQQLYKLLQKESVTITEIEEKIVEINKEYESVISINEQFNKKTDQFNNEKLTFYEKAGFQIKDS